ncbi:MAG: hypothetical protein FJ320_02750 [SAR202 cluster bacterium]|nr:hypothetical protein [SAR202 cluster bacterium]
MDRIKSAYERAMEKIEQLEKPNDRQRLEWKLLPEGQKLAGEFIKGESAPFSKIAGAPPEHRPYLVRGMANVLISNLQLPRTQATYLANTKMIEGLERLLKEKPKAKELLSRAKYVSDQYWQFAVPQREQTRQQLKMQMEQQVMEALSRQRGTQQGQVQIQVETLPEFQQQWMRIASQIDRQYEQHLEENKKHLVEMV